MAYGGFRFAAYFIGKAATGLSAVSFTASAAKGCRCYPLRGLPGYFLRKPSSTSTTAACETGRD